MARFTLERDPDGRISGARSINPENHTPMSDILPPPGSAAPAEPPGAKRTWYQERSTIIASALALALLLLVITFLSDSRGAAEAPGAALPTASVVGDVLRVRSASAAPAATPAPPAGWSVLARSVTAYDEPSGAVLGELEQGRAYRAIGRYGEWLLIEAQGSGGVTIRAAEAGIAIDQALADYAPPPPPPAPAYQAPPGGAPAAPPAPRVLPLPETPIVLINALAAPPGAQYDSHCGGSNPPLVCAPGDTPGGAEDIAAGVGASAAPTPQP